MKKIPRNDFVVLNVVERKETYRRIEDGTQKVVFEYPERKRAIEHWYAKSASKNLRLVVKVWCDKMKKGNRHISFICDVIWDDENWSWMGWLPEEKFYDEFDEPTENHYVLYLGDRIN